MLTGILIGVIKNKEHILKIKNNLSSKIRDMPETSEVISRLKFLTKVKKGEKINVNGLYVQPESYVTSISRTLFHIDNRNNTLSFIQNTIDRSFELVNLYTNNHNASTSELSISKNLIKDIIKAKDGINNLKSTYHQDTMFICNLDAILENIDAIILELQEKKSYLFDIQEDNTNIDSHAV